MERKSIRGGVKMSKNYITMQEQMAINLLKERISTSNTLFLIKVFNMVRDELRRRKKEKEEKEEKS